MEFLVGAVEHFFTSTNFGNEKFVLTDGSNSDLEGVNLYFVLRV
jgi:hypothetical protein